MIALNMACIVFSAYMASQCRQWSFGWWFNITASALNAAVVAWILTR